MSAPIRVLFVDDEPAVLRMIQRALHGSPFEVLTAPGGEEALATLRRDRIDVLVSDIDMPGMSGLELVATARRELPGTLRMLLTGAATLERTLAAINEGEVLRCFLKPVEPELLRGTLLGLVERIERQRREGEGEARRARRDELERWVEARFPGVTTVARDAEGRIAIDLPTRLGESRGVGSDALRVLLPDL